MFEAYQVGVTLRLHNLISPELALLAKGFEKLDLLTNTLNKSLRKIKGDSSVFRGLTTATNSTNKALERASINAANLHRHLSAVSGAAALSASRLAPLLPGPRGSVTAGGGGGGGRHNAGGFHGGNVHLGSNGVGIGSVGLAAGDAFVPLALTAGALYAGKALFESAKELDTERQRFKLFGLSDAQNAEAFKFAAGMHIYGSTQTENLRNFREAQGVFREAGLNDSTALDGAKLAAPILSKLNALDGALDEEAATRSHASNLAMLRFVESAGGLKSQAEFKRLADIGYRLKVGSGDTVDWQKLQQFEATGGSSVINLTGEGLARLEPSMSTLGGGRAGTALATGFGRLQGIVKNLPVSVIDELLTNKVWDRSKVELNSKGGIAKFLDPKGPLSGENSKLLAENPELFYERVIRPIYEKMGLDAAGIVRQNALIYGRTGGALANEWEKQLATIEKAVSAFQKTLGIDAATAKLPDSLTGQQKEFEAAWTDFKTQFGTTMLPFFSGILKGTANIFRGINNGNTDAEFPGGHALEDAFKKKLTGSRPGQRWVEGSDPNRPGQGGHWESDYVAGKTGGAPLVFQLNADAERMGITVAPIVSDVQGKSANGPQTGINTFDSQQALYQAGSPGF